MTRIAQGYLTASKVGFPDGEKYYNTEYTDFVCGLGANLISIENSYSKPTLCEEQLGERIVDKFPFVEKIKILKTGTEACNAAVRIARAYQEKNKPPEIIKRSESIYSEHGIGLGYHGWGNNFVSQLEPGVGCVDEHYIKLKSLEDIIAYIKKDDYQFDCLENWYIERSLSYVIIEPVELDYSEKRKEQLIELRRLCDEKNIVLIFDEVITGFRFPDYCVSNYFGVIPDLIILGKGMGNGYPISVVGGRAEIMDNPDYFISGTFFGEVSGIKAAINTMDYLTPNRLQFIWDRGYDVMSEFNQIDDRIKLYGYPTRGVWVGEDEFICTFCQQMEKRGYLLHPKVWFFGHMHTQRITDRFLESARECLFDIEKENIQLKGPVPEPVFRRHS